MAHRGKSTHWYMYNPISFSSCVFPLFYSIPNILLFYCLVHGQYTPKGFFLYRVANLSSEYLGKNAPFILNYNEIF